MGRRIWTKSGVTLWIFTWCPTGPDRRLNLQTTQSVSQIESDRFEYDRSPTEYMFQCIEGSKRLGNTELHGGRVYLKLETRLRDEMFESVRGEYEITNMKMIDVAR